MGWLQKRPQLSDTIQLYTLGQHKTILLVGLGNIGRQYTSTRHNVGFLALDVFVATHPDMSDWIEKRDLKCHFSKGRLGDTEVIAIKPTTLMNLSGEAVQAVTHFYKIIQESVLVLHDELDIPFGQIRLRVGGGSAGHNGIKSITDTIGDTYGRVRIGIGPKKPESIDSADFVLQAFDAKEQTQLPNLTREVNAILTEYIYGGKLHRETRNFLLT
jgi:PTH1 family peptidyl-tRNA hydrolase